MYIDVIFNFASVLQFCYEHCRRCDVQDKKNDAHDLYISTRTL